jgi:4-diphosphocytidyl-2-C-methyl-D-erythritol kinase
MTIEMLAPAKVNLGLEVVRRRTDGYHDIATVFQTISLFDRIRMTRSDVDEVRIVDRIIQIEANLAERALVLAKHSSRTSQRCRVEIVKRIPVAAGLGGASADAAAVLTGLAAHSRFERAALEEVALALGTDVPFLIQGGAALAHGRGNELTRIAPLRGCWFVLASPRVELERKTARLYDALTPVNFSSGGRASRVAAALESGTLPGPELLANAFERPIDDLLPELSELRKSFIAAGAPFVALTGAGPTHYTFVPALSDAIALARELWRCSPVATRVLVARPTGSGPMLWPKTTPAVGAL